MPSARQSDALSHFLTLARLRGERVYTGELRGQDAAAFKAGPPHFHLVESGVLWIHRDGAEEPLRVNSGGLVLLVHGMGHAISAHPQIRAPLQDFFHDTTFDEVRGRAILGAGEAPTQIVGGQFRFEGLPLSPVIKALPAVIHIRPQATDAEPSLSLIARLLLAESTQTQPGSALMISRVIDLIVIHALRTWASTQPPELHWFGSRSAERIGRALNAIQAQPSRRWTLEELARLARMSRSVFAQRFAEAVGEPPLRYLSRWRLSAAAELISSERIPIGEVAYQAGYSSEAGFSRAFRAFFGISPRELKHGAPVPDSIEGPAATPPRE